ncbi:MAG: nucleotidyltransferase domain-containing protein [Halanaerobiales bacterium]|nr:nucleotidyltransferase domain-containing protein [Halanaerobiales bacterium]
MRDIFSRIPERYTQDIKLAIEILKDEGCTEIYLFGSLAEGDFREDSDIDLAVKGCPRDRFFHVLGKLLLELNHKVDLINLDGRDPFAEYLIAEGGLIYVA